MSTEIAVSATELTKTFAINSGWRPRSNGPRITAVDRVTLTVDQGELFGLLGPNGAGKTTLVKMLSTLILPTSGRAMVAGYPLDQSAHIRRLVGLVVSDERSFYWRLTGRQNLEFFSSMYSLKGDEARRRIDQLLEEVDLTSASEQPFRNYSSGMRQRLAIARSMLHHPGILFLDEPSRSLDPVATSRLHGLISRLATQQNVTIFLITHDLAEAEKLCRRVAIMNRGRIEVIGHPAELRHRLWLQTRYTIRVSAIPLSLQEELNQLVPEVSYSQAASGPGFSFYASQDDGVLDGALELVHQAEVTILSLESQLPSLEKVFAHYTSQELTDLLTPGTSENPGES